MGRSKKNRNHETHSLYLSPATHTHTNVNEQQMHIAWNSLCCIVFAAVCNVGAFYVREMWNGRCFFQIYIFGAEVLDYCWPYKWEIYMNQLFVGRIALVVVAVIKTYKITFTLSVVLRLSSCPRNKLWIISWGFRSLEPNGPPGWRNTKHIDLFIKFSWIYFSESLWFVLYIFSYTVEEC